MDVMDMARSIGLVDRDGRTATGTIEEGAVLAAISELAAGASAHEDLFADAAMQVQLARSAGVVEPDPLSVLHRSRDRGRAAPLPVRDGRAVRRSGDRRRHARVGVAGLGGLTAPQRAVASPDRGSWTTVR